MTRDELIRELENGIIQFKEDGFEYDYMAYSIALATLKNCKDRLRVCKANPINHEKMGNWTWVDIEWRPVQTELDEILRGLGE